jgi:hypothetical protein
MWEMSRRFSEKPSTERYAATGIDGCIAMVNSQLAVPSVQQHVKGEHTQQQQQQQQRFHSKNLPSASQFRSSPKTDSFEPRQFGSLGSLSEYYFLGRNAAKSQFLPFQSAEVDSYVPAVKRHRPEVSHHFRVDQTYLLPSSGYRQHRHATRVIISVVDSHTARKVQRGDFASLHTLRDFYRRIDRQRDSRRQSWSRSPAVADLFEVRQFRDDYGNGFSDSELVIDLSVHKKGAAPLKSSDDFRLNLSDRLCPPESDVYWKSKSCGSSPLPGLNQFVVCPDGSSRYPSGLSMKE